ncbi:MAG: NAD/NADP octopine/nopaline dehydrogenase family protein [Anaerolineae bacterium]|jgi:opine dehydrogenase
MMNIAVLGSGNGGCAVAFDWAMHKHSVHLFDFERFPDTIEAVKRQGGIYAEGELEGFAPVQYAGHDIEQALNDVEVICLVGPAYSTRPFAEACRPYLRKGHVVLVCPGSCMGSLAFKNAAGLDLRSRDVIVAETSTLPYAVRVVEPGRIRVFLKVKDGLFLAAVPSRDTPQVLERTQGVYPLLVTAKNVLQTSLQNGNPVIHPAVTLLNAALIGRTEGDFYFYEEGVTAAVGQLIKAIDRERISIGQELDIDVIPEPDLGYMQGYMAERSYDTGYAEAPGFRGIKAQSSLNHRYFREDVAFGLVFWRSLAEQIGVETPTISAVIQLASVLTGQDYLAQGKRTMESLGLSQYATEELGRLLA